MTFWNFYFRIFDKAVGKEETVLFLAHLLQHIAGPLLIVWDRLGYPRIAVGWCESSWMSGKGRLSLSTYHLKRRNSTPWNTCGATGNITNCPMCARKISGNSAMALVARCAACVGVLA